MSDMFPTRMSLKFLKPLLVCDFLLEAMSRRALPSCEGHVQGNPHGKHVRWALGVGSSLPGF